MDQARYLESEQRLWESLGVRPVERRVRLEQNGLTVRIQELGEGPPVLFVSGVTTSGSSWSQLAARMKGLRCLLLDRPGTGLSERPKRNRIRRARLADSLVADVLDGLGLGSAHVVGTSLGGFMTLRSAAAHPDRISRMVQFGWPVGASRPHVSTFLAMTPILVRMLSGRFDDATARRMFRAIGEGPSVDAGRIMQEEWDCYVALVRHTRTVRNDITGNPLPSLNRVVGNVRAPTLFLWGENDPFGGPEVGRRLVERMPNAELEVLAGAGHAPWFDDIDYAAKAAAAFLTR